MKNAVLIVDDEPDILEEAAEALADEGYGVHCAGSVDQALEILHQNKDISLVVTDLKMPGKTGADLIRETRQGLWPEMIFIVMSGHGNPSVDADEFKVEKFVFLRKPLDIEDLIDAVKTALSPSAG